MIPKATGMRHPSAYLDWYVHVPNVMHDFRSSGLAHFRFDLTLSDVDLSVNFAHGNPRAAEALAKRYSVKDEHVFISSEGASGQNGRVVRCLAERDASKNEAIVEYPTYEPLLRQVQEYFPHVKRLERKEDEDYGLDADKLGRLVSNKTGLFVLTNPHAPSGAIADLNELKEIMAVAKERNFFVVCDEIYAEFDRNAMPTLFSVDPEHGIVTTSLTKAYGLGGLKLGVALAKKELVDEFYTDVLNTVGNSPNIVQLVAAELLTKGKGQLEKHKQKWIRVKNETENWLKEKKLEYFPNRVSVTFWVKTPLRDTHTWVNEHAIPRFSVATVPGAFFLFKNGYEMARSSMIRLGVGNISPDDLGLGESLEAFGKAVETYKGSCSPRNRQYCPRLKKRS